MPTDTMTPVQRPAALPSCNARQHQEDPVLQSGSYTAPTLGTPTGPRSLCAVGAFMWGLGPAVLFGAVPALGPSPSPYTRRPNEVQGPTPAPAGHEEAEQEVALGSPWAPLVAAGPHSGGCRGSACGALQGAGLTPRPVGRCAGRSGGEGRGQWRGEENGEGEGQGAGEEGGGT